MTNELLIFFIRHGQTDWNAESRIQGWSDIPINETGKKQILTLAHSLKTEERFDLIISSDLLRAKQSAEIISDILHVPIIHTENLRERRYGIWEGMEEKEIYSKFLNTNILSKVEGQETYKDFYKRIKAYINIIQEQYSGKKLLIVSHGGVIGVILSIKLGISIDKFENATFIKTVAIDSKWILP